MITGITTGWLILVRINDCLNCAGCRRCYPPICVPQSFTDDKYLIGFRRKIKRW